MEEVAKDDPEGLEKIGRLDTDVSLRKLQRDIVLNRKELFHL